MQLKIRLNKKEEGNEVRSGVPRGSDPISNRIFLDGEKGFPRLYKQP